MKWVRFLKRKKGTEMSKNKRKKKIKRTPQQLQKIHEKRMMIEERNRVKRELELKQKLEKIQLLKLETEKNILNQLTEEDWKDMWFHVTHSKYVNNIQKEGLKGGNGKKWGDGSGFLYLTKNEDKELWNGIGSQYVIDFDTEDIRERMSDKDVTVIGIPKKVFELMDCSLLEDFGGESMNYDYNHIKVQLNGNIISPSLLKVVDEFMTDTHLYETSSIWKYLQMTIQRDNDVLLDLNDLCYEDGMLGRRTYKKRFETTSSKLFNMTDDELKNFRNNLERNRILNGTSSIFNREVQHQTSHTVYSEVI